METDVLRLVSLHTTGVLFALLCYWLIGEGLAFALDKQSTVYTVLKIADQFLLIALFLFSLYRVLEALYLKARYDDPLLVLAI